MRCVGAVSRVFGRISRSIFSISLPNTNTLAAGQRRFALASLVGTLSLPLGSYAPVLAQGMSLPGDIAVQQSGAATYAIQIAVPPGTAGMSPSLTLTYNSQRGNGILGMGWSLDGLPAIARCAKTIASDGTVGAVRFDANDRFCLDGQRLVAISGTYGANGTLYRTEIESFGKITSYGTTGSGPTWFEVRTKSGQILHFGNSADSRALSQGGAVRSWSVNKVSDTKGNYYSVTYTQDTANGQVYPARIDYTGNTSASLAPYNSVRFVYEMTRPDPTIAYLAGTLIKTTVRLANLRTYRGETMVSDYQLQYQQTPKINLSTVTSIKHCVQGGVCLPATTMSWPNADGVTFGNHVEWQNSGNYSILDHDSADFNGDGKADHIFYFNQSSAMSSKTFLSNGDGTFAAPVAWAATGDFSGVANFAGDFNGDGRADIMFQKANASYWKSLVALSNGDGTFGTPVPWQSLANYNNLNYSMGDYNGDGRTDIMLHNANASFWKTWIAFSNGDGTFGTPILWQSNANYNNLASASGDIDGDGRTDIILHRSNSSGWQTWVALSNGDGSFQAPVSWFASGVYGGDGNAFNFSGVVDINGDGRGDLLLNMNNRSKWRTYVALSKGDGTFATPVLWEMVANLNNWQLLTGDFNGDGRIDILLNFNDASYWRAYVALSKGDGTFATPTLWEQTGNHNNRDVTSGDFNGDGRADIALIRNTNTDFSIRSALTSGPGAYTITSIANGLGNQTTIVYKALSEIGAPYTKGSGALYPTVDFQASLYVASEVQRSNGIGGTASTTYAYSGARGDSHGHGMLGFQNVIVTDPQTGIKQTITYRVDFPFIGLVASETKTLGALTLNQVANSYQFKNVSGGTTISPTSGPYQVFLTQSVASSADLDGTAMPSITSTYQYDAYGNPTEIVVSTSDGFSKTTTNTYNNNTTDWLLGRLTGATVSSTAP